jgi:hypothetical protein
MSGLGLLLRKLTSEPYFAGRKSLLSQNRQRIKKTTASRRRGRSMMVSL